MKQNESYCFQTESIAKDISTYGYKIPLSKLIKTTEKPRNDPGTRWDFQKRQKQKNNTQDSNVVPHRSTN